MKKGVKYTELRCKEKKEIKRQLMNNNFYNHPYNY